MVKVDIYEDEQGNIIRYKVSGHAESVDEGADLVCNSVSVATQIPIIGLERHLKLKPSYSVNIEDGILEVALNSAPNDLTQSILMTMLYGLQELQRQSPKYVRIKEHRVKITLKASDVSDATLNR